MVVWDLRVPRLFPVVSPFANSNLSNLQHLLEAEERPDYCLRLHEKGGGNAISKQSAVPCSAGECSGAAPSQFIASSRGCNWQVPKPAPQEAKTASWSISTQSQGCWSLGEDEETLWSIWLSLATRTKATQAKLLLNKQVEIKQKQFLVYTSMMSYCVTLQFNTFTQMIIFVMTTSTGQLADGWWWGWLC